jgi:putative ABC transport system permease protein
MKIRAPTVLGLSIGLPFTLYVWRLRTRAAQELLAAVGIAVGVALVFGVLVANTSIGKSAGGLVHQLVGSAQLQLAARSQEGFSQGQVKRVEALPGVLAISPLLRENVVISGSRGREAVQLIGATDRQVSLNPQATRDLGSGATNLVSGGIGLPSSVAESIGARAGEKIIVRVNGKQQAVGVSVVLGSQTVGAVADSPIAITLLDKAQQLTGQAGRVTNLLVEAEPGAEAEVAGELRQVAAGRLNVTSADNELRLLSTAAKPNQQSTTLFAAIAGMVGFLLALNAMLLTMPERRRLVVELRTFGYDPAQIGLLLVVQALALGLVGSLMGIALGDWLSHTLFGGVPSYLIDAFPIGQGQVITLPIVLIAVGSGVLAALLASVWPLFDLRSKYAVDMVMHQQGEAGQTIPRRAARLLALTGVALVLIVTLVAVVVPSLTIIGGVLLAFAAVCLLPFAYRTVLAALRPLCERSKGVISIAVIELDATATRSVALAAIAALAVYGSLAIGGARTDLIRGIETAVTQYESTADIWVTTGDNVFNTDNFHPDGIPAAIARAPDVASVNVYRGGLLDVGERRMWVRAKPASDTALFASSQLLQGNYTTATRLIRDGGWAAISSEFASERRLHVGSYFSLPTPSGAARLGVAAITTNLGWPAGAITLTSAGYSKLWHTTDAAAFEVSLKPGVSLAAGRRAVLTALGPTSGLNVQTFREREVQTDRSARQGLSSLGAIATLILITGALAVAASLGATISQRRTRLAAMKTWGYDYLQLWRSILLESAILLAIGCVEGAILGLYGHMLADRWLRLTTDFPAPFAIGGYEIFITLLLIVGIAMSVVAVPGFSAAQVPASASFQE